MRLEVNAQIHITGRVLDRIEEIVIGADFGAPGIRTTKRRVEIGKYLAQHPDMTDDEFIPQIAHMTVGFKLVVVDLLIADKGGDGVVMGKFVASEYSPLWAGPSHHA